MKEVRLDKYLTDCTKMSRKEAKECIRKGRVQLDGQVVKKEGTKVKEGAEVSLDGETLYRQEFVYLMMNKPTGVVSATKDRGERTVVDLVDPVPGHPDLFPVGRLDKDTEGFLLLTDDGETAHRLLAPGKHVEKKYYLQYEGTLCDDCVQQAERGIDIGEKNLTRPAVLKLAGKGEAYLTICEGKFHQVKRMIAALGGRVSYLKRISMGSLELDKKLQPGDYRMPDRGRDRPDRKRRVTMAKKKYYAVKKGKVPGVYETWDACKAQTHGFPGAVFKSFPTREEAQAFVGMDRQTEKVAAAGTDPAGRERVCAGIYGSYGYGSRWCSSSLCGWKLQCGYGRIRCRCSVFLRTGRRAYKPERGRQRTGVYAECGRGDPWIPSGYGEGGSAETEENLYLS